MVSGQESGLVRKAVAERPVVVVAFLCVVLTMPVLGQDMNWTRACSAAAWSARFGHTSVVFDNKMWVMGGSHAYNTDENDVWYSSDGDSWILATASAPWPGRHRFASVVFDNKMWVMGGYSCDVVHYVNDVWYSSDGDSWTQATAAAPWSGREGHTALVFDNKMWVIGGVNYGGVCGDVWYSSDGDSWYQATDSAAWSERAYHTSVVFDSMMWIIGGDSTGASQNDAWCSSDGVDWTSKTETAPWQARSHHTSVIFDGEMWLIGGCEGPDSVSNDVWYSPDGDSWTQAIASAPWRVRCDHTSVVFDNKIWVMGGDETDDVARKNDVWWSPGVSGILEPDAAGDIRFALQGLRPNPFRDNATIMFAPPRGKRASVRIYSSAGALVKVLAQDAIARGAEGLEWNGVDQTGATVPPGQYFVRFDCEATTITRKLTKLD